MTNEIKKTLAETIRKETSSKKQIQFCVDNPNSPFAGMLPESHPVIEVNEAYIQVFIPQQDEVALKYGYINVTEYVAKASWAAKTAKAVFPIALTEIHNLDMLSEPTSLHNPWRKIRSVICDMLADYGMNVKDVHPGDETICNGDHMMLIPVGRNIYDVYVPKAILIQTMVTKKWSALRKLHADLAKTSA